MKLAGRIVVKESNQGVANLLVVACDAGGDTAPQLLKSAVTDHGSDASGRLASVLTEDQGAFSMVGDDLTVPGHAGRPNLLVVVFAPEDVQSSSRPYPLPQEKRILYLSAVPRTAAGTEEAFVIRLLQEQIDQFGISQPNSTPTSDVSVKRQRSLVNRWACLVESPADQCVASSRC